eukprot:TRINITY_DN2708_c0_g1_i1.p1 TRINITY_DN2708_c0_g1~~TRINITY_DN2708_c0_g1_i1.p1  ORF type:complete len:397 (-),score=120.88 TRINITY_DN2708_c0_g1_i1:154-1344(-)
MDREELVKAFQSVTGATEADSRKYLETHNWDIDMATALFLEQQDLYEPEHDEVEEDEDYEMHTQGQNPPSIQPAPVPVPTSNNTKPNPKKKAAPQRGGMRTLADLKGEEDSSGDEDDHEDYYAGGGERSGQMIQAPKGNKGKPSMKGVFDAAKQQGAEEVEEKSEKPRGPTFGGTGYTLGDGTTHSQVLRPPPAQQQRVQITRNIIFWQNGFSVDDGPLRKMDDPANRQFLASVQRGEVPQELEDQARAEGGKLHINLVDNHTQEYKEPPKPKVAAFSGSGHTLGSTATPTAAPAPTPSTQPSQASQPSAPRRSLAIDESKPTTSIQIRLADGTRMVSKFNHNHTIQDIRNFIDAARRQPQEYDLITTFPQKTLSNFSQTITEAGLLNAVVVQKYK